MTQPLDRPVWQALATRHAGLALGDARARRYDPAIAMFAAAADDTPESLAALAALVPPGGSIYLIEASAPRIPAGLSAAPRAAVQMVALDAPAFAGDATAAIALGDADAAEMLALATLTAPGPFLARTHELGGFVGIRASGRLVAMAGERMKLPGYTELSGVCTHPQARGRGHAGLLSRIVMGNIAARGETPILHAWADNHAAIALYETLGFRHRSAMTMTALRRG